MNSKPRVGFFEFSSCEGCQLTVLNCEDELLGILGKIEIVNFREAMSEPNDMNFDLAFVEGSITRQSEIERLEQIRKNAAILVALGSCAHIGCVNLYKNSLGESKCREIVYGFDENGRPPTLFSNTIPARPIHHVVKVDFFVPGCPIDKTEFLNFVQSIVLGRSPKLPDTAVCVDCKLAENGCLLVGGQLCLGPVTRAGCHAICPSNRSICWGCRGTYPDANFAGQTRVLQENGISSDRIEKAYAIFQSQRENGSKIP